MRAGQRGLRAFQRGLRACQRGLGACQRGNWACQRGLGAYQKGLRVCRKGLRALQRIYGHTYEHSTGLCSLLGPMPKTYVQTANLEKDLKPKFIDLSKK